MSIVYHEEQRIGNLRLTVTIEELEPLPEPPEPNPEPEPEPQPTYRTATVVATKTVCYVESGNTNVQGNPILVQPAMDDPRRHRLEQGERISVVTRIQADGGRFWLVAPGILSPDVNYYLLANHVSVT